MIDSIGKKSFYHLSFFHTVENKLLAAFKSILSYMNMTKQKNYANSINGLQELNIQLSTKL